MSPINETRRIIEAHLADGSCDSCALNSGRHFDECPQHPENVGGKSAADVLAAHQINEWAQHDRLVGLHL